MLSNVLCLEEKFNVPVVGSIGDTSFWPRVPKIVELFPYIWYYSIVMAFLSFSTTYSLGGAFENQADKAELVSTNKDNQGDARARAIRSNNNRIRVDPNQELIALGWANIVGSFFMCIPAGASLSRSAIQVASGGRTQMTSIVNAILVGLFAVYLGPLISSLPKVVLAATITYAIRLLLLRVLLFFEYWKTSKPDAFVFLVTFGVQLYEICVGTIAGLVLLIIKDCFVFRKKPRAYLLGIVAESTGRDGQLLESIVPIEKYAGAKEIPRIKIFQFCASLVNGRCHHFPEKLNKKVFPEASLERLKQRKLMLQAELLEVFGSLDQMNPWLPLEDYDHDQYDEDEDQIILEPLFKHLEAGCSFGWFKKKRDLQLIDDNRLKAYRRYMRRTVPRYLIIDCSTCANIDTEGIKVLKEQLEKLDFLSSKVLLAGLNPDIHDIITTNFSGDPNFKVLVDTYFTVAHAVNHARAELEAEDNLTRADVGEEQLPQPSNDNAQASAQAHSNHQAVVIEILPDTEVTPTSSEKGETSRLIPMHTDANNNNKKLKSVGLSLDDELEQLEDINESNSKAVLSEDVALLKDHPPKGGVDHGDGDTFQDATISERAGRQHCTSKYLFIPPQADVLL